jgi:signal transduction histidine kinase
MKADLLSKLGEPFITTRGQDGGMGLGVYVAKLIAEQLGGSLEFHSELGSGTRAVFKFPANNIAEEQIAA